MKRKTIEHLGPLQKQIMEILWKKGQATVGEIKNQIDSENKLSYTTFLSAVQRLTKDGWIDREEQGRAHVFFPATTREKEGVRSLQKLLKQIFHGDRMLLFQNLIRQTKLDEKELGELQQIIEQRKEELKK